MFIIFSGLNRLNFFYLFTHFNFPLSIVGYVFGVGITEEFTKMLPLLYLEKRSREPILAQTLVYYGLMAGIAFGVFEGVEYQTTVNINADYTSAFLLNIARLTSLPFMHAVWAGIAGYLWLWQTCIRATGTGCMLLRLSFRPHFTGSMTLS